MKWNAFVKSWLSIRSLKALHCLLCIISTDIIPFNLFSKLFTHVSYLILHYLRFSSASESTNWANWEAEQIENWIQWKVLIDFYRKIKTRSRWKKNVPKLLFKYYSGTSKWPTCMLLFYFSLFFYYKSTPHAIVSTPQIISYSTNFSSDYAHAASVKWNWISRISSFFPFSHWRKIKRKNKYNDKPKTF